MAAPGLSETVTATEQNRAKRVVDLMSKNNGLMWALKNKKRVVGKDGGENLVVPIEYQESGTFGYFDGYEELDVTPQDILTSAVYEWKNASTSASLSGSEKRKNSGKARMIPLLKTKIKNAEKSLANNISVDLYSDGTGSGGKQIGGLDLLVSTTPSSGTVGTINRATWAFWRNIAYDAVNDGGGAVTSSNIQTYMNRVALQITRKSVGDKFDLITADNNYYQAYLESLLPNQRFSNTEMADASFQTLKFQGADVIYDGGIDGGQTSDRMHFLTTDYLELCYHKDANFSQVGGSRVPVNQDAETAIILFMGNLVLSNAFCQAVLFE